MFIYLKRGCFLYGLAIWAVGTVALRLAGQRLLIPGDLARTLILYAASFPLMLLLSRRLCQRSGAGLAGAVSLVLPTLLLDTFSSAFFPFVFPNMAPDAAGIFGGWMLWCCAGALLGVA